MAGTICLLFPPTEGNRREVIKCTPMQTLQQVLAEACSRGKRPVDPNSYILMNGKKEVVRFQPRVFAHFSVRVACVQPSSSHACICSIFRQLLRRRARPRFEITPLVFSESLRSPMPHDWCRTSRSRSALPAFPGERSSTSCLAPPATLLPQPLLRQGQCSRPPLPTPPRRRLPDHRTPSPLVAVSRRPAGMRILRWRMVRGGLFLPTPDPATGFAGPSQLRFSACWWLRQPKGAELA